MMFDLYIKALQIVLLFLIIRLFAKDVDYHCYWANVLVRVQPSISQQRLKVPLLEALSVIFLGRG